MKTTQKFIVLIVSLFLFSYAHISAQGDAMSTVKSFIESKYPGSIITEIDSEKGNIEVEIVHNNKEKDLVFSPNGEWQSTSFDIKKSELPKKIKKALEDSKYSSYRIDDIELHEAPKQSYYKIDLEKMLSDDLTVYISKDGKFF